MCNERLAATLDGARWIKYDPNGFVLAWFGGHGLHVYDISGREVDYRSVGDFAQSGASEAEIRAAALAWAREAEH